MTEFVQLHLLTSYPPSNLNRDDLGRPKTAVVGGAPRLRVSSQSLKRAWRTSELFEAALAGHVGTRTKTMGSKVFADLKALGLDEATARKAALSIAGVFGKVKAPAKAEGNEASETTKPAKKGKAQDGSAVEIEQLAHFSPEEIAGIDALVAKLAAEKREPTEAELLLLKKDHRAADIALFGRMLADKPYYNVEAAAQVAHAITIHKTVVEDDYFSAVDDLNTGEEDRGAGHIGESDFAAGLFYLYICIDRTQLLANLQGDEALTQKTIKALTEAAAKIAPTGKQNSYASRAYASYIRAEKGTQQPRSLAVAYLSPVAGDDYLTQGRKRLEETTTKLDAVYGPTVDEHLAIDTTRGEGSFAELLDFVAAPRSGAR